jgi:hypothetical protein
VNRLSREKVRIIEDCYRAGATQHEAARESGATLPTVQVYFRKYGPRRECACGKPDRHVGPCYRYRGNAAWRELGVVQESVSEREPRQSITESR